MPYINQSQDSSLGGNPQNFKTLDPPYTGSNNVNYDQLNPKSLNGYNNGSLPDIGAKIATPQLNQYSAKLNEPNLLNQNYRKKGMLENPDKYQGINGSSNFHEYQRQQPYGKHSGLGVTPNNELTYPSE